MTIFTTTVAASADDAQELAGTNTTNGTNLNANAASHIIGLRFTGVTVPAGSTINAAYLTVNITSGSYDDPDVTIRGGNEANPAAFTTATNHLTDRSKTATSVAWSASNVGAGSRNTPDLATLVTDIIALGGWASGNAMAFYITGSGSSALRFTAYDNGSSYPSLTIDYTAPSAGGQPRRTVHQFRLRS